MGSHSDPDDIRYKGHTILLSSVRDQLGQWVPTAIIVTDTTERPRMVAKALFGSAGCTSQQDADAAVLQLAREWIDKQERSGL